MKKAILAKKLKPIASEVEKSGLIQKCKQLAIQFGKRIDGRDYFDGITYHYMFSNDEIRVGCFSSDNGIQGPSPTNSETVWAIYIYDDLKRGYKRSESVFNVNEIRNKNDEKYDGIKPIVNINGRLYQVSSYKKSKEWGPLVEKILDKLTKDTPESYLENLKGNFDIA